jgi:hypothetical protein
MTINYRKWSDLFTIQVIAKIGRTEDPRFGYRRSDLISAKFMDATLHQTIGNTSTPPIVLVSPGLGLWLVQNSYKKFKIRLDQVPRDVEMILLAKLLHRFEFALPFRDCERERREAFNLKSPTDAIEGLVMHEG